MFNFMRATFTSLQATTLYEIGLLNLGLKRYQTAIEYFTQAIALDSKYADAFYQRSIAFQELGEQQNATADFKKAVKLNPKLLDDMFASAIANVDFKLYPSAIEKFDYILGVNPKLDKVFTQRALAKCALRAYKEAIQDFDEAIKLKPAERTYCDRGNAKAALGLYEEAMADYQQALQLNPQNTYALLSRGITTYELGGRYYQALDDFKKVLELDPTYAAALYHEGVVRFELGDFKNANLALDRSIGIAENKKAKNVNTYVMSGIVKLTGWKTAPKRFEYACELISKQIAFDPSDIDTKIELLEHLESTGVDVQLLENSIQENYGNMEKFRESINEATHPHLAALAYYYIARAYQINSAFDKAEETFLQSIKLEENSKVIYDYANLLIKQKKWLPAISKLQRAIELSNDGKCITYYRLSSPLLVNSPLREELKFLPRLYIQVSVLATWQLINCYIVVGDKNNAEQQLDNLLKAVRDFPTPLAYSLLGYAYRAFKQWAMAARSFKTATLLHADYFLAQQNLQTCLNQLPVQESDVKPFAIIDQTSQSPISSQSQELVIRKPKSAMENAQLTLSKTISQLTGLKYQEIPGNGHCLFTAVGLYLGEDQSSLRVIVARYIERNLSQFAQYLALPPGKTIEDYLQGVRSGQEWADHIEIEVLMRVLNRPIMVIDSSGLPRNSEDANRFEGEPIFVYYNGRDHYDALLLPEEISGKDVLGTITNHSDQLIDLQQPLTQLSEHSRISQSSNPLTRLYEMGLLNLGLKRYPTAIEYFTQAIEFDSKYADAFYQRSIAFEKMREPEKATADLQKARELNPKFLEDMFTSAMAEVDFKLYQSAIEKFDDILRGNPKLDKVFIERALIKWALRNYKDAIQDFNEAIKLKPEERTYCDRGNAKAKLGFYEEAMADYRQALQLNPQNTYALLSRGITTYELGGRYYQALDDFKKVLESDPTYALALYHDGLVRFELGDFKNADVALEHSIRIAENKKAKNVNTYVMSGIVKLTAGLQIAAATKFEDACKLISKKIAFDPSDIETKMELLEHVESIGIDDQLLESIIQEDYDNLKETISGANQPQLYFNLEKLKGSINETTHPHLAALAYYYIARAYQINAALYKTELVEVEETFLQSIKLEENSRVNYEYANLLIQQEKWVLAISKLQRAIELSNDGKCITYYNSSSALLLNSPLREELKLIARLYIRVSVLATWQLINCYIIVGEKNHAEQQLNNLLKAVEDFPSPLANSLLGHACQALKQWHLAARSFKTALLLRANYSLAQQNLRNCLNQLSVQEDEIKPFEIIAQTQQLLVPQNSESVTQKQESTIRSTNFPQLSDNKKQEIDTQTATERSKLNPKQHSSYESMSNRISAEANSVNEIKSATYYEFYQLTDSHQSGGQLLKLPMEEFVSNQNQKSSQQKSKTEAALPPVQNLPNQSKEENEEELNDGQDNRFQL